MNLLVEPKIFEQFSALRVGVIVLEGADNAGAGAEILKLLRASEREAGEKYSGSTLGEMPQIACWRHAYKTFSASDYRSSVEALLRRAIKGDALPDINPLVNLYNALSLKYLIPFGGEDLFSGSDELAENACKEALSFAQGFLNVRGYLRVHKRI